MKTKTETEMKAKPLDAGQKHILRLIARDCNSDGWATVSSALYGVLCSSLPPELVTFEPSGGAGRARLTGAGRAVVESMAWLSA
jgi:hypothetical protein